MTSERYHWYAELDSRFTTNLSTYGKARWASIPMFDKQASVAMSNRTNVRPERINHQYAVSNTQILTSLRNEIMNYPQSYAAHDSLSTTDTHNFDTLHSKQLEIIIDIVISGLEFIIHKIFDGVAALKEETLKIL